MNYKSRPGSGSDLSDFPVVVELSNDFQSKEAKEEEKEKEEEQTDEVQV